MTDEDFDAAVMAPPVLIDNAGPLHPLGYLEGDWCACGAAISGDVERCEECAAEADSGCAA